MNKLCTSLEQSQKLIELGIDVKTADMCYRIVAYNPNDTHVYQPYCFVGTLESDIPAWSFSALLNYLREIDMFPEIEADEHNVKMSVNYYNEDEARPLTLIHNITVKAESFIDACVEMIIKLKELKLL